MVIDHPVLARLGIDAHAIDQADASDESMRIATELQSHQLDLVREVLVQHRIVEDDITMDRGQNLCACTLIPATMSTAPCAGSD